MKLELDFDAKTIKVIGQATFREINNQMTELYPKGDWLDWSVLNNDGTVWNPTYVPYWEFTTGTGTITTSDNTKSEEL